MHSIIDQQYLDCRSYFVFSLALNSSAWNESASGQSVNPSIATFLLGPHDTPLSFSGILFLAVHNSSIGDLVPCLVCWSVRHH